MTTEHSVSRRRKHNRVVPLRQLSAPWDESVVEAVRTRSSAAAGFACLRPDCRTCRRCIASGRAIAAAQALRGRKVRKSAVSAGNAADSALKDVKTAFQWLLALRSPQMGVLNRTSQIVRASCLLQGLRRMAAVRMHRLLDLLATNKLATEAEQRDQWYVSVQELHRLLFVAGAHGISDLQAKQLFEILDGNSSGSLHLTELLAGLDALLAECTRQVGQEEAQDPQESMESAHESSDRSTVSAATDDDGNSQGEPQATPVLDEPAKQAENPQIPPAVVLDDFPQIDNIGEEPIPAEVSERPTFYRRSKAREFDDEV